MASNPTQDQASMVGGHAQYGKGYVEETIGNVTGSKEWQESGKKDQEEGINSMRAAKEQSDKEPIGSELGGRLEQKLGAAAGCEGMEDEGKVRVGKALDDKGSK